jgi:hypothetical protein
VSPYTTHADDELDDDVEIAARSRVPVLITAPPDRALRIAREIMSRVGRTRSDGSSAMQVCDTSAGDDVVAALAGNGRDASMSGETTVLLKEVHMLSGIEQAAIMELLDARPTGPVDDTPRLITTSSVSLFDRVQEGAFNAKLFHRLNVIHIVVPLKAA